MPRSTRTFIQKSLKTICIDTILFFAFFALVGHLTINFWERYTIQTELSTMKHSLHTLKDTITNIGKAYDSLHTELKDLFKIVNKKQTKPLMPECIRQKDLESDQCKDKCNLDRRTLEGIQVQAVNIKPNKTKVGVGTITNNRFIKFFDYTNKSTGPLCKNVAINTKNPPKSTGISSNMSSYETEKHYHQNDTKHHHEYHNHLRSYKDFENYRRICNHANA